MSKYRDSGQRRTTRFRHLVEGDDILMMPAIHDVLSARFAEQAGFEAITSAGYGTAATLLGQPDVALVTQTEFADHYARVCDAVSIPVFGDADTGFGNTTNTARTTRLYERAGLAGMLIEDQVFPKRCGHMAGKEVVSTDEMVAKLKAALDARQDTDFVIMARTDALAVHGMDEAIDRMALYREVGADMLFVEAPRDTEQMRRLCRELDGPCVANMVEGGLTPIMPLDQLREIGFAVVIYAVGATQVMAHAVRDYLTFLKSEGASLGYHGEMIAFEEFVEAVGLSDLRERERGYEDFAQSFATSNGPP